MNKYNSLMPYLSCLTASVLVHVLTMPVSLISIPYIEQNKNKK